MSKPTIPVSLKHLRDRDYLVLPPVRIGDLVRFNENDHSYIALITFLKGNGESDQWWYGGVQVGSDFHETVWIDVLSWLANPDAYEVVGSIDLSTSMST